MRTSLHRTLGAIAIAVAFALPAAGATVLSFDDLPIPTAPFVENYQGFMFGTNDSTSTAWYHSSAPSSYFTSHSGLGYITTNSSLYDGDIFEDTQVISSATPFVFDGAWVSGINQVRFKLYSNSTLVYTSLDSPELAFVPMFVPSGYDGSVTSVLVVGRQGYFALDDFTVSTPVPEPERAALMLAGLLAVAGIVTRRNRASR